MLQKTTCHLGSNHSKTSFMKPLLFFISFCPIILFGEIQVSNADLSRKLDLILEKVSGLEKRVTALESESASVQQVVKEVAQTAEEGNGFEDDLNVEIALTYTGIENLVLGGGMHSTSGRTGAAPVANDVDITNLHAAYTMDKLMLGGEYINVDEDGAADDLSAYLILADYDINDKMGIAVRYSEWDTAANAESDRITIAPNYAITDSLGAILEYSSAEDNAGNEDDTLAIELTFTF